MKLEAAPFQDVVVQLCDELADAYAAQADTKPHNAYYERPATMSLIDEIDGKKIWTRDAALEYFETQEISCCWTGFGKRVLMSSYYHSLALSTRHYRKTNL